jgi:hypothetical protein
MQGRDVTVLANDKHVWNRIDVELFAKRPIRIAQQRKGNISQASFDGVQPIPILAVGYGELCCLSLRKLR